jgi:hypothetical protein
MAFRAAATSTLGVARVIAVGGDVPGELGSDTLRRVPATLIARGTGDNLYTKNSSLKMNNSFGRAG